MRLWKTDYTSIHRTTASGKILDMNSFFADLSKLVVAAFIVLVLGFAITMLFEDDAAVRVDAQHMQSWLSEMEAEEEKGFKAETLKEICASESLGDEGWCTGYMLGFAEGHQTSTGQVFCLNDQFSSNQLEQSLKNFMEQNPQHWGKSRSAVLTAALLESFPCD